METNPNQKVITTHWCAKDKKNIYGMISVAAMDEAMALLKPNTFKVWCYMARN
jgi:hypothetical protein